MHTLVHETALKNLWIVLELKFKINILPPHNGVNYNSFNGINGKLWKASGKHKETENSRSGTLRVLGRGGHGCMVTRYISRTARAPGRFRAILFVFPHEQQLCCCDLHRLELFAAMLLCECPAVVSVCVSVSLRSSNRSAGEHLDVRLLLILPSPLIPLFHPTPLLHSSPLLWAVKWMKGSVSLPRRERGREVVRRRERLGGERETTLRVRIIFTWLHSFTHDPSFFAPLHQHIPAFMSCLRSRWAQTLDRTLSSSLPFPTVIHRTPVFHIITFSLISAFLFRFLTSVHFHLVLLLQYIYFLCSWLHQTSPLYPSLIFGEDLTGPRAACPGRGWACRHTYIQFTSISSAVTFSNLSQTQTTQQTLACCSCPSMNTVLRNVMVADFYVSLHPSDLVYIFLSSLSPLSRLLLIIHLLSSFLFPPIFNLSSRHTGIDFNSAGLQTNVVPNFSRQATRN